MTFPTKGVIIENKVPLSVSLSALDALYQVSEKLEGPFNMELAADSISVKVSEAIMHMQENSVSISTKVWA